MLNRKLKKCISYAISGLCVASLPFVAFCYGGNSKKANKETKPFKSSFSPIEYRNVAAALSKQRLWKFYYDSKKNDTEEDKKTTCDYSNFLNYLEYLDKNFEVCEGKDKNKHLVLRVGSNKEAFKPSSLNLVMEIYKEIIFEPGSVGSQWIASACEILGANGHENVWKKELFPLNEAYERLGRENALKAGYKLVLTDTVMGNKIIFNIEFGNCFTDRLADKYSLACECNSYNNILDVVLPLNPVSSTGNFPRKITKEIIKYIPVNPRAKSTRYRSFCCAENMKTVKFLGEIDSLSCETFYGCESLSNVFFKSVKHIENNVFEKCSSLEEIDFPEGLETIGEQVFKDCRNLKIVTFPSSLKKVHSGIFNGAPRNLKIFYKGTEFNKRDFLNTFKEA